MTLRLMCLLFVTAMPWVSAQDEMAPPSEMSRYAMMAGNWTGSGSALMDPDAEPMDWTMSSTIELVLGGHCYRETSRIDFPGSETPMIFHSFYGFDVASEQYKVVSFSNGAGPSMARILWLDDNTMTGADAKMEGDDVVCERWVSSYKGDSGHFKIERALNGGDWFVHVEGTVKRGGKGFVLPANSAEMALEPPAEEMKKLPHLGGKFVIKDAKMIPMPGMPVMEISATENASMILGGHASMSHIKGEPIPAAPFVYEAYMMGGWDPDLKCYRSFTFSNSGEFFEERGWIMPDGKLVNIAANVVYGMPQATRTVVTPTEGGYRVKVDRSAATADPDVSFDADIKRVK